MNESALNAKKDGFMGPKLLLTLAMTVTGILSTAHANSNAPQERWEGYRRADSEEVQNLNLPFQEFAENAVLETETVANLNPGEQFDVVDVTTVPQETNPNVLTSENNKVAFQIETCRKQGLRYCPVLGYTVRGTAFFNRGRFLTCRHGFHNWISLASQLNGDRPVSQISPPMILRNAAREVLYNSGYDGRPQTQFSIINDDPRLNYQSHEQDDPSREQLRRAVAQADYVEMTLSEPIVRDFALTERNSGTRSLKLNEETYLFGFPIQTNSFPGNTGEAPGYRLVVSQGFAKEAFHNHSILQTTNFTSAGASGAPIITANGELAGMNCRGPVTSNPAESRSYAFPIGGSLARRSWAAINYPSESQLASLETAQPSTVSQ